MAHYLKRDHVYLKWEPSCLVRVSYLPNDLNSFGVYAIEVVTRFVDPLDKYLINNYTPITEEQFNDIKVLAQFRIDSFFKQTVLIES